MLALALGLLVFVSGVNAHIGCFARGGYCMNGLQVEEEPNSNEVTKPLFMLPKDGWWFHGECKKYPPPDGEFLNLPAGESFTVELSGNKGQTSLSFNGAYTSKWLDGQQHPDDMNNPNCITQPNMHTQNQSMAAGTAFAISYHDKLEEVTMENLAVFTVRAHTPWFRVTTYDVPKNLPACPAGGCTCAWLWIADGCGEPNIFMSGFKCNVTGSTSNVPVAEAKPPVYCQYDQSKCQAGAKQMLVYNQLEGNNVNVDNLWDHNGYWVHPGYNYKWGFNDGAQNDIFEDSTSDTTPSSTSSDTTPSSTPLDTTPSSTLSDTTPSSTPLDTTPSSTPLDTTPSSTLSDTTPSSTPSDTTPSSTSSVTTPSTSPSPENLSVTSPSGTNSSDDSTPSSPTNQDSQCNNRRSDGNFVKKSTVARGISSHLKRRLARQL